MIISNSNGGGCGSGSCSKNDCDGTKGGCGC